MPAGRGMGMMPPGMLIEDLLLRSIFTDTLQVVLQAVRHDLPCLSGLQVCQAAALPVSLVSLLVCLSRAVPLLQASVVHLQGNVRSQTLA